MSVAAFTNKYHVVTEMLAEQTTVRLLVTRNAVGIPHAAYNIAGLVELDIGYALPRPIQPFVVDRDTGLILGLDFSRLGAGFSEVEIPWDALAAAIDLGRGVCVSWPSARVADERPQPKKPSHLKIVS